MNSRFKKILFGFIMGLLLLPLLQQVFDFVGEGRLYGAFDITNDISWRADQWLDGSYQEQKSKYINDHAAFRADLIRLNCQIDYSLFHKLNTGWGIFGKDNCLLDDVYIDAWNGSDFIGDDTIRAKMIKFKALQDTFARMGKTLFIVHAASKAYYYSDLIPDEYKLSGPRPTNFKRYMEVGDSLGVNQLDLNTYFCAMKDTAKELLYPKQGIHWSMYGGMVAGDSITRYIEKMRGIKMPHPYWEHMIHTTKPRYTDDDIARVMNLIWPITTETFTYGDIHCEHDSSKARPNAIYIGDSFVWTLADNGIFDCINNHWEIWFYMKEMHAKAGEPRRPVAMDHYDWMSAVNRANYIMLIYTAPGLKNLGSGFIEKAYAYYFPDSHL